MWLSLLIILLLLSIAYFHAIQGLFSALLSAVLAILCTGLAFATYEYVAVELLVSLKPDFALGLALMGMFVIPLYVLRTLLDKYVHRACLLPLFLDKAGGFVFGVITAYVMVGMLAICLQLLPFGNGVLGFARLDRADPAQEEQNELWLKPDRFAARLASMLSGGILSGEHSFARVHPDFVTEIGWIEGVFPTDQGDRRWVRRFVPPGSMSVMGAWEDSYVYRKSEDSRSGAPEYIPKSAPDDKKLIRVQMQLRPEAQDADNQHRFTLYQVRLVGDVEDDQPAQYHAIAVADSQEPDKAIYETKGGDPLPCQLLAPAGNMVDVVFEVPKDFTPRFAEYKSGARDMVKLGEAPLAGMAVARAGTAPTGASGRRDRVSGVALAGSLFSEDFPNGLTMTNYQSTNVEIDHAKQALKNGHIHGWVTNQGRRKTEAPVSSFDVPADKRLLHLSVKSLAPQSTFGKARNLAVTTVKNYIVTDSSGRQYLPVGGYVAAKLGVKDYVEIQYFPEYAEMTGRGIQPWERLRENRLQGDYTYVLLYLINPGAKLVGFSTGGGGAQAVDLTDRNLVAPR